MSFVAAREILGASARVRMLTIAQHPELPDGTYVMVEIGELREGDARLAVATCAKDSGVAKSTTSSGSRLFVAS